MLLNVFTKLTLIGRCSGKLVVPCFDICMKRNISIAISIVWVFVLVSWTTSDHSGVQWKVTELTFNSNKSYGDPFNDVNLDALFTHSDGTVLKVPAFWNGGNKWVVRFAPTLTGKWTYRTSCTDESNTGLHNRTGKISCAEYKGNLDIYRHGFVKTTPSRRYFTYNNYTPFFYIGDTHWNLPANTLDNFKTIINKRVEQGFTVIQSQPICSPGDKTCYDLSDGTVSESDLPFFSDLDKRFQYVAEKGLVHANAQLFFVVELGERRAKYPDAYLEKLCRYWVARYSAYPVMWTTAQESDDDCYGRHNIEATTNPWKHVASFIHKYDPYRHPLTAHQESSRIGNAFASNSSFKDLPGHSWFAAQWKPKKEGTLDFDIPKDFWENGQGKPTVNYEADYDHLWTLEFGARNQGWTAFLNGMFGHGYGATDIWLYNSTYNMDRPTTRDGVTVTVEDKSIKWNESVEFPAAYQMGYMRNFFETFDWWNLVPRFDNENWFINDSSFYSISSKGKDLIVVYFYNPDRNTGILQGLKNTTYTVQWFNPIDGKFLSSENVSVTNNSFAIGEKPDNNDWVLLVKII